MQSATLLGRRIITLDKGEDLGQVREVIFDPVGHRVAALLLGDKDLFGLMDAHVVLWEKLGKIGENAIMVDNAEAVQKAGEIEGMTDLLQKRQMLKGGRLYTEDGKDLGRINDVLFQSDGSIFGYELSGGLLADSLHGKRFLPANLPLRVGSEVVFVDSKATQEVTETTPDFDETVGEVKKKVQASLQPDALETGVNRFQNSFNRAAKKFKESWDEDEKENTPKQ